MAPDDERPTNRNCPWENDDNPFAAFRRYADEAMASVLQGFIGLPSGLNFPNPNERWIPFDEQARRRAIESWESRSQDSNNNATDPYKPREVQHPDAALGRPHSSYHGLEPPVKPYMPREHPHSSGRFYPWGPFDLDFFSYRNTHQPMADWILQYLQNSSYSPRNLESMHDMGRFGLAWRRAFEDLLDAEYGKELKPRDSKNRLGESEPHALNWAWKMSQKSEQYERENGDQSSASRAPQSDEQAKEFSELDMYEQFLGKDLSHEKTRESLPDSTGPSSPPDKARQLGIISTLTTTERVVLPDGTTNTKVVLKKRFSDGREETSESVHTTHGTQKEAISNSDIVQGAKSGHANDGKSKEKKGWFWT